MIPVINHHPLDVEDRVKRIKQGAHDHELPRLEQLAAWASRLGDLELDDLYQWIIAERRERTGPHIKRSIV